MRLVRHLTRRMVTKLFLVLGLVVGTALLLQARADGRRIERSLKQETHISAERVAQLVIGAVEHSMLAGDGVQVRTLVSELKQHVPGAEIRIFDRRGVEVFAPKPPAPDPASLPPAVRDALAGETRTELAAGRIVRSIPSEERCERCHDDDRAVRGALAITFDEERCRDARGSVYSGLVRHSFVQLMTAEQSKLMDDFLRELVAASSTVDKVGIYDGDDLLTFGAEVEVGEAAVDEPFVMEERCVECHDEPVGEARGALRIALADEADADCGESLELAVDRAVRFIMLANLGRRVTDFLDAMVDTGAASELSVFDEAGREVWTTVRVPPPPEVAGVLRERRGLVQFAGVGEGERVMVVEPLENERGCHRCHGTDDELRGAVEVSLSTGTAARARAETLRESTWFTGYTLAGVLVILVALLQYLVVRPVNHIGAVADEVGQGNLDVEVARAHAEGDEVARLGSRVNEMVRGLRAKMNLEKLVSRGAAEAAASGIAREGELRRFAILFSDIRGFTAFSEERPPEYVVAMLNQLLEVQAHAVHDFGGDIDKYVGDELMALFHGPDAEARAVQCARAMVDAVAEAHEGELAVGIGIHTGDVIYGAIGHEDRLDYTVIGDVVNTAARLCSVAAGGQILVSEAVAEACPEIELERLEPVSLKGKKKPFPVLSPRPK